MHGCDRASPDFMDNSSIISHTVGAERLDLLKCSSAWQLWDYWKLWSQKLYLLEVVVRVVGKKSEIPPNC